MRVNGRPLAALVYGICELDGHLGGTLPERGAVPLANGAGVFGTEVKVAPRTVSVGLDVRPAVLADRSTLEETLRRRLSGLLELATDDKPGRVLRAELRDITPEWYTGQYANPAVYLRLTFFAPDPSWWDVQPLTYGLSTARTACPVGAASSSTLVEVFGPCSAPVVILRSHTGAEVLRTEFNTVLGVNDALVIDSGLASVTRLVAGVVQTGAGAGDAVLAGGRFPVLSPEHGAPDGTTSPTLELAAQSGTPTGTVTYFRRW